MGAWAGGVAQLKIGRESLRDQQRANADLTRRMEGSQRAYEGQRPANSLARRYALQNMLGMYGPANEMLGEMTGGRYSLDLQQPTQRWPDMAAALQQTQPINPNQGALQAPAPGAPRPAAPGWSGVGASAPLVNDPSFLLRGKR
jgi:hypothetical protein